MTFDIALSIAAAICVLAGVLGCIMPVIPGPVMCLAGLIILHFTSYAPFSVTFLGVYAGLTVLAAVLDYVIPVYGTKKLQGSKYGIWGCTAGLIVGIIFFFPLGLILGPMAGAFLGELLSGKTMGRAMKSSLGSLLGFLASAVLKITLSLAMAYHLVIALYEMYAG